MNHKTKILKKAARQHASYHVGYARPPQATQFKPGHSGNPGGRPKGISKRRSTGDGRLGEIVLEEAYRAINIQEQNGQLSIPIAQAIVRSLMISAARGEHRAQRLVTTLLNAVEQDRRLRFDASESRELSVLKIERVIITPDDSPEDP